MNDFQRKFRDAGLILVRSVSLTTATTTTATIVAITRTTKATRISILVYSLIYTVARRGKNNLKYFYGKLKKLRTKIGKYLDLERGKSYGCRKLLDEDLRRGWMRKKISEMRRVTQEFNYL